ncbi:MAG: hypothetical protein PHC46_01270 [Clostridia bacterium]|nr:hypothetical protein [Clostridia bacterium]
MAEKDFVIEKARPNIDRPNFDYFNANNFAKMQATTETEQKELGRFKNNYSTSRLNKVYEKYNMFEEQEETIEEEVEEPSFKKLSPSRDAEFNKLIREQNAFEEMEDTLTYQKIERNPKVKLSLNSRTKLAVFTYAFVTVMLGFLLIYNAVSLSNISANINNLNGSISAEQANIERVIKDIGNMTDEDNVLDVATDLSFAQVPAGSIVQVTLYDKQTPPHYEGQTNWFDSICKFLNGLFGG